LTIFVDDKCPKHRKITKKPVVDRLFTLGKVDKLLQYPS